MNLNCDKFLNKSYRLRRLVARVMLLCYSLLVLVAKKFNFCVLCWYWAQAQERGERQRESRRVVLCCMHCMFCCAASAATYCAMPAACAPVYCICGACACAFYMCYVLLPSCSLSRRLHRERSGLTTTCGCLFGFVHKKKPTYLERFIREESSQRAPPYFVDGGSIN